MEHPRWGATMAVQLTRDVSAGEEIYTYYDYERLGSEPSNIEVDWYWELKRQSEKEERLEATRKKSRK